MNYLRTILLCILFVVFIFIGFGYNQENTIADQAFAQKVELICSEQEIPVGTLINQTNTFHKDILTSLFLLSAGAKAQIEESELLMNLGSQCKAENCTSSCQTKTVCSKTSCTSYCVINACSGNACPTADIATRFTAVNGYYTQVQQASTAIHDLITKKIPAPSSLIRNCPATCGGPGGAGQACPQECSPNTMPQHITNALKRIRASLKACVTPENTGSQPEKDLQRIDTLYSCQEAKFLKILNDTQQQCTINNFFCCSLQVKK